MRRKVREEKEWNGRRTGELVLLLLEPGSETKLDKEDTEGVDHVDDLGHVLAVIQIRELKIEDLDWREERMNVRQEGAREGKRAGKER